MPVPTGSTARWGGGGGGGGGGLILVQPLGPPPPPTKKKKIAKNRIENSFLLFAILNVFIRDLNVRLVMTISWL